MLIVSYFDKYVTFFILRGMEERTFANLVSMHFLFNLLSFGKYAFFLRKIWYLGCGGLMLENIRSTLFMQDNI